MERTFLPLSKIAHQDMCGASCPFPPLPETRGIALTVPEQHLLERAERAVRGTKSHGFPSQAYNLCS